jgi:hypothetical protein
MATARHPHHSATDARRAALNERLRVLKGVAVGASAALALGLWWLVGGVVASNGQAATPTTVQPLPGGEEDSQGSFFGSGSSLGSGAGQVPLLRSGGS